MIQIIPLCVLLAFTLAGLVHGLRIRRTSFYAGTSLPRTVADRPATGWLAWFFLEHPALCRALDRLSDQLPGPRSEVEDTLVSSTTFTGLQSRMLLHRYFRWQVHNLLRTLLALMFCGVLMAFLPAGLNIYNQLIIAGCSIALAVYAFVCFRGIRIQNRATEKMCAETRSRYDLDFDAQDEREAVLGAFTDLARGAGRQAVAFAIVWVLNLGLQLAMLVDTDNRLALNQWKAQAQQAEEVWAEDPSAFAG